MSDLREACQRILPYLRWTIGPESPGHHPTMPSAVAMVKATLPAPATASAGWQDIETAPKDGTLLLLGWPTFHPLVGHCEDDLWGQLNSDFGFEPFENAPSHWMPLPPAPTITRKSGERV